MKDKKKEARNGTPTVGTVERRTFRLPTPVEVRAEGGKKGARGIGIAVGVTADIGPFTEEIDPRAIAAVLEMDVRGLYNHNEDYVLGRTKSGTMTLRKTKAGVEYDIPAFPATRADVLEVIERGDVDGSSFSFTVDEDGDEWEAAGEGRAKPHRKIFSFRRVYDMGPVAFPAYEGDAVVSARSIARAADAGAELPEGLVAYGSGEGTRSETTVAESDDGEETPPVETEDREDEETEEEEEREAIVEPLPGEIPIGLVVLRTAEERAQSDSDLREQLQDALRAATFAEGAAWVYVYDVFSRDGFLIFAIEQPEEGADEATLAPGLYRTDYEIDEEESRVTFSEPVRVRRVTTYEPVAEALRALDDRFSEMRSSFESFEARVARAERRMEILDARVRLSE